VTSRGDRTRDQIISAAELLFAERGILAVSLREINVAAGQRNTAALHYHFQGRSGVIGAIGERHLPRVDAAQHVLLQDLFALGREDDLRGLVDAVLVPQVEYLRNGPSERAWMKICSAWVSQPHLSTGQLWAAGTSSGRELRRRMVKVLAREMPIELARERVFVAYTWALHGLADRARLMDATEPTRPVLPEAVFAANLSDMYLGALNAPVSAAVTQELLATEGAER
jgi:AcrR family transcriptional regulator